MQARAQELRATTVLCVQRDGKTAMGADGQVTLGQAVIGKATARKVHKLSDGKVLAGVAGSTSDALNLLDKFEKHLQAHGDNLRLAAVEFAKSWGADKLMRQFNAQLAVCDADEMLLLTGTGDVIVPEHNVMAIGSGMGYATAAARALLENTDASVAEVVDKALRIAADICVFTNHELTVLTLED